MKINYRQLSILVFMSFIALKFLALPSLLYREAKNMSWFVSLVMMLIDVLYACLILRLMRRSGSKNIHEFMVENLGIVLTKIIMVLFVLKFSIILVNISKGLEFFVVENLYREFSWLVYIIPLIILVGFMAYKGIRNIARVTELVCWAVVIGLVYIGAKVVAEVDLLSFLPMFHDGAMPLFSAGFKYAGWFGSSTFLFMLFGMVDFTKAKKIKMVLYIVLAIVLVEFLYFTFYGLFQITSPTHNFMLSDISQFSSGQSSIDELSWLVVSLWILAQAVQMALYAYCLSQAIRFLFNIKKSTYVPVCLVMIYMFVWGLIGKNTAGTETFFYNKFISILSVVVAYVVPLIIALGSLVNRSKDRRKIQPKVKKNEEIKINI